VPSTHLEVTLSLFAQGYKLDGLVLINVVTAGDTDLLAAAITLARYSLLHLENTSH
jgi:hypothetical protein